MRGFRLSSLTGTAMRVLLVAFLSSPATAAAAERLPGPDGHALLDAVLRDHVRDGRVDYRAIKSDERFWNYLDQLAATDPDTLPSREARLALWINAYNAYTIQLIIDRMPLKSIRDIGLGLPVVSGPWSIEFAAIGGKRYTLNAIEHDIIRPRFRDPRIHFALVCAAVSCPKLRPGAYEAASLDRQLDEDARAFLADPARNRFDTKGKRLMLSQIFNWFSEDFVEASGSVQDYVARHVGPEARALALDPETHVEFLEYDWSLNSR